MSKWSNPLINARVSFVADPQQRTVDIQLRLSSAQQRACEPSKIFSARFFCGKARKLSHVLVHYHWQFWLGQSLCNENATLANIDETFHHFSTY